MSCRFWPVIDSALREAACTRGVEVKLLVSCWSHSPGAMFVFLQSLSVLNKPPLSCNIDTVRFFIFWQWFFFFNPCITDDLIPINILHTESFRGALNTRAAEDSVCTCQPRKVHGDWSSCLHWYVSCLHAQFSQRDLTCMLCHIAATWRQVLALHHKNLPTETVHVYIYNWSTVNMSYTIKWMSDLQSCYDDWLLYCVSQELPTGLRITSPRRQGLVLLWIRQVLQ